MEVYILRVHGRKDNHIIYLLDNKGTNTLGFGG